MTDQTGPLSPPIATPEPPPAPLPPAAPVDTGISPSIFKKLIPFVFALIGLGLLFLLVTKVILPAFGKKTSPTTEPTPVTLTYWGLWEVEPIFAGVINEYKTIAPHVTINYKLQNIKDYRERLQSSLARGEGPDIFRFHNSWVPMLKNDLLALSESSANYYPVVKSDLEQNQKMMGLPLMYDGLALLYNKAILSSASATVPTDWSALRQLAFNLTQRDGSNNITRAGIALGTTANVEHWSDILALMLFQNGADLTNPTSSAAVDALNFYTIFSRSDKIWDDRLPPSITAFANGQVAMIFAPSWQIHVIKSLSPSLDFGVAPLPQLPGTNIAWATYWADGVSVRSPNQEEAVKFLKYLAQKDTLIKLYSEASKTRLFGELYPRVDMKELLSQDEFASVYLNQAPQAKSFYLASNTYDNGINDKIIKYYEDAVNAISQGQDPATALQTTAQGVQQVLAQYGVK